ncbi:fasciclin-like arabinogalactan protein 21 [Impatiens glandulifera]|uniref:fasciclin-like arabinogalactan protein 21 n=1 Tax=Impatiens glandulifera TaxID=253017 RepID=UPI001FB0BD1F|nr:fasciclin-like arabinogalactan protein 21 [Impatiens glandulifera]
MTISIITFFFKQFTFSAFIFLCITIHPSSSSISPSPSPAAAPPPSAIAASEFLKKHGYSIFASIISLTSSLNSDTWNTTGTIFAPPDFAFSFTTEKFTDHRCSLLPRPSSWLLLLHTLKQTLTWNTLIRQPVDEVLHSWLDDRTIFLYRGVNGETFIATDGNPVSSVRILHPDLYISDNIVIHGVDGVLDPASVSNCLSVNPNSVVRSEIERYYLDHAVRVLRKKGFSVVANALSAKRFNLTRFPAITVFAPSDSNFNSDTDGLNYDVLRHVVPRRMRLKDMEKIPPGTSIETMATDRKIVIRSVEHHRGSLTANGFAIDGLEVYHNKWVTVLGISQRLDQWKTDILTVQSPGTAAMNSDQSLVKSPAPESEHAGYSPASSPRSSNRGRRDMEAMVKVIVGERLPSDWYTKLSEKFVQSGPSHESNRPLAVAESKVSSSNGDDRMDHHLAGDLFFYT